MKQTPVHDRHNPDLLEVIPRTARRLVEVGCSSGALAREVRKLLPGCHYTGVEIDSGYGELAKRHCDEVDVVDIEAAERAFFNRHSGVDCWIFGDTLEHLRDPWRVLRAVRGTLAPEGAVVACIPNAQHWSILARLAVGDFRYADQGLLDRTHLRWFTRQTVVELFSATGYRVENVWTRIFDEPARAAYLPAIGALAAAAGVEPALAQADAVPLQYVVRAIRD